MIIRSIDAAEIAEAAELQRLVFRPDEPDAAQRYLTYAQGDPTYTLDHSRVVFAEGRLVAHLRIWDRVLRVRGAEVSAAGIGSLCTHPDFRGRGYARALLRDSERHFLAAGYDIGLLFSIIGTPFYQAQGWIPVPMPTFALGNVPARPMPYGVRPLDSGRDWEAVQALYQTHGMHCETAVVRDRAYWTAGPAQVRGTFPALGAERDGQLVGYLNFEAEDDEVWISEVCGADASVYGPLAEAALSVCDGRKLEGSVPRDHAFVTALETISGRPATWGTHDEMMVKGVNWPALRDKIGAALVPEGPPEDEARFWRDLLGDEPFYCWADIF